MQNSDEPTLLLTDKDGNETRATIDEAAKVIAGANNMSVGQAKDAILSAMATKSKGELQSLKDMVDEVEETRKVAPRKLTPIDKREIQEASRQLAAMVGCTPGQAMSRIMAYGASLGRIHSLTPKPRVRTIEERPCLNCGKMKQHNNSFCSAGCCKAYRAKGGN